ncbi:HAMP domain-containing protein, partial [Aureimonas leprariae]|uniref:HAMP domain-containing protein n=1 Tax=Plantimonas leprariae TaxID=2615207 RepID=UPI0013874B3D
MLFASAVIGGLGWYRQSTLMSQAIDAEASSDLNVLTTDMEAQQRTNLGLALALAGDPAVAAKLKAGDREALLAPYADTLKNMTARSGIQLMTFADANGMVVGRVHEPAKFGDDMKGRRKTVETAIATGQPSAGVEPGKSAISIFGTVPVTADGAVVGVVDVGTQLTGEYFSRLAKDVDGNFAVYVLKEGKFERQASTYANDPVLTPDELQAGFNGTAPHRYAVVGDKDYLVSAVPLVNFSGAKIGVIEAASDVTALMQSQRTALWLSLAAAICTAAIALAGFYLFARSLGGVIRRMTMTMARLAAGDLNVEIEGQKRPDELGSMAQAVQVFKDGAVAQRRLEA